VSTSIACRPASPPSRGAPDRRRACPICGPARSSTESRPVVSRFGRRRRAACTASSTTCHGGWRRWRSAVCRTYWCTADPAPRATCRGGRDASGHHRLGRLVHRPSRVSTSCDSPKRRTGESAKLPCRRLDVRGGKRTVPGFASTPAAHWNLAPAGGGAAQTRPPMRRSWTRYRGLMSTRTTGPTLPLLAEPGPRRTPTRSERGQGTSAWPPIANAPTTAPSSASRPVTVEESVAADGHGAQFRSAFGKLGHDVPAAKRSRLGLGCPPATDRCRSRALEPVPLEARKQGPTRASDSVRERPNARSAVQREALEFGTLLALQPQPGRPPTPRHLPGAFQGERVAGWSSLCSFGHPGGPSSCSRLDASGLLHRLPVEGQRVVARPAGRPDHGRSPVAGVCLCPYGPSAPDPRSLPVRRVRPAGRCVPAPTGNGFLQVLPQAARS